MTRYDATRDPRRSRLVLRSRLGLLVSPLLVIGLAVACSSTPEGQEAAAPGDGGVRSDGSVTTGPDGAATPDGATVPDGAGALSAGPKAGTLLTAPTQALADQAAAEHTPTAQETAIIGVYWAFIVTSSQAGTLDPTVLQSGLQAQVLAIAGE